MAAPYFIGIDVGTQGARVVLMDSLGNIVGTQEEVFPLDDQSREEQSPALWWEVCLRLLKSLVRESASGISLAELKAISVTSTSGTVIPLDEKMQPLHNAIMYSDKRSAAEGRICSALASQFHSEGYTGFNSSSGLSKMLWFVRQFPEMTPRIAKWIHACDYIIGKLTNRWAVTDYTNALKSGYDVRNRYWPAYLYEKLPLKKEWFPEVLASGTPITTIFSEVAIATGLPPNVLVVAGMTDGCASQIASGAVKLGDWNTTIGTTLVVKGVTENEISDPEERLYSHRHPEGYWMPGGASNTGADWVTREFGEDLAALNGQAVHLIPTGHLAYPLRQEGERFPFIAPQARGFQPEGLSKADIFTANMEGVAYIERYAYEMIENLSGEKVKAVYTAGGGSKSDAWLSIRSNVLNLPIYKMKHVSGAVGAAILAASKTHFASVSEAVASMTRMEKQVYPEKELSEEYDKHYRRFLELMIQKGYMKNAVLHA
jgi:sugar (pentulose or hexulose) kinase